MRQILEALLISGEDPVLGHQICLDHPEPGLVGPGHLLRPQPVRDVLHVVVLQPEDGPGIRGLTAHPGGGGGVRVDIGLQEVARLHKEVSLISDVNMDFVRLPPAH